MAGGSYAPRWAFGRGLSAYRALKKKQARAPAAIVGACLILVSCVPQRAAPTPELVPTLVVVTATPGPPPVPTPGIEQRYVVREGDTLSAIAARFGVSEEAILDANGITDPDRILVGQELSIPPAQP